MRLSRVSIPALLLAIVIWTGTGCQSGGMSVGAHASASPPTKAVVVNTAHGGTLVYLPNPAGGDGVQAMSSAGTGDAECAECRKDAANYFKTGKIEPVCGVCGAHRSPVIMSH